MQPTEADARMTQYFRLLNSRALERSAMTFPMTHPVETYDQGS